MIQFSAHFDGKNICPDEPVSLPQNIPLLVTVDAEAAKNSESGRPLDLFERLEEEAGLVEGPTDWAAEHDHYLYSAAKKGKRKSE
ncbi:MAG TPA: hypothetical protein VGK58_16680 [Lacipirellulaceae bacterium]